VNSHGRKKSSNWVFENHHFSIEYSKDIQVCILCSSLVYICNQAQNVFFSAGAMQAMVSKGIVHRDLKPQNILLAHDGRTKNPQPQDITLKIGKTCLADI
jgi:serine/threonine protein kinase